MSEHSNLSQSSESQRDAQLRQVTELTPVMLMQCDLEERYTFVNRAYAKHRNRRMDEIIGNTVREVVGEENYHVIAPYVQRVLAGESIQYEAELSYGTLGMRTVSVSYEPELDESGQIRGWISAISDVTDVQRSRRELDETRSQLDAAFAIAQVGSWTWDVQRDWTIADKTLSGLFFGRSEISEGPIADFFQAVHPDDRAHLESEVARSLQSESGQFECEYRIIHPNGETRWVIARGRVERNSAGTPVQFPGVMIDITERKQQEEALAALSRKLESQRHTFDIALSHITDFVYMFDRAGRFIFVNQPLLDLWGLPLEQAVGRNFFDLKYPDALAGRLQREIEQVFQTHQSVIGETAYTSPTGESGYFEYIFNPVFGANGLVETVAGSTHIITDRKRQEAAVSDLVQRIDAQARMFDATLSHIADLAYMFDQEARVIYANKPLLEIWGLTLAEAVGKNCFDLKYPAELAERLNGQLLEVIRTGNTVHGVTELASAAGVMDVHEYIYNPVRDLDGRIVAVTGTTRIITQRNRIENALRESEQRLSRIMDLMPAGVYACDAAGLITFYNRRAAELWGREPRLNDPQDTFCACQRVFLPDGTFVPSDQTPMAHAIREGRSFRGQEAIVERPDGSRFVAAVNIDPVFDDQNRVIGAINVFQDLTESKAGLSAQSRLAAIVASSDDAIISKDLNGIITSWNAGAEQLFGYSADEMIGQSVTLLIPSNRVDEEPGILDKIRRAEPITHYETIRRRKDGRLIEVSLSVSPIKDESGVIIGAAKIARDITEQKRTEAELKESRDAAEQANRTKDQFLAVLSHELRTPLTPVLMAVAARQLDASLSPALQADFAMIRRNVELETKLIDDLLDLSRITSGKLNLRLESVDLNETVANVVEICRSPIREKGVVLECHPDPANPKVWVDSPRLQQVLWNLLKNAEKFTPERGRITVRAMSDGETARVEVSDSGAGIASDILPRIFNAFEQGDARVTRQFGGLGLGLAISQALMELHGGRISAESAGVDLGAKFAIELPIDHQPAEPTVPQPSRVSETADRPLRVLIAEDHEDTVMVLSQLMKGWGHEVAVATSVAEALKLLKQQPFDILVSDLGLPDATGYELMKQALELAPVKGIAMSGYGMEEDIRKSREAGFSEHLVKPVNLGQLERLIQSLAASG